MLRVLQASFAHTTLIFHIARWHSRYDAKHKKLVSNMGWPQALEFLLPLVNNERLLKCGTDIWRLANKLETLAPYLKCRCGVVLSQALCVMLSLQGRSLMPVCTATHVQWILVRSRFPCVHNLLVSQSITMCAYAPTHLNQLTCNHQRQLVQGLLRRPKAGKVAWHSV